MFFSIFFLSALVAFQSSSICDAGFVGKSPTFLGTCASSPIKSSSITCHARVTYDDDKLGTRTIGGHLANN